MTRHACGLNITAGQPIHGVAPGDGPPPGQGRSNRARRVQQVSRGKAKHGGGITCRFIAGEPFGLRRFSTSSIVTGVVGHRLPLNAARELAARKCDGRAGALDAVRPSTRRYRRSIGLTFA
ncbi:hypothetical protein GU700_04925 [Methylobacterium sp. NI91]|nr:MULTISPECIES: hypothetical protein [unclassified Methylobacterium]QIJ73974.1 hypothetical protein CLZ_04925 [Methylobacterium sp. CLZ]QIJ78880.1 hypothetical protein GU700_04925 [Methylobacterium sp. NI91]